MAIVKMCIFIPVLWGFKEEFKEEILSQKKESEETDILEEEMEE